ncbi:MAG: T9SS type A sorting domain-containing protein [Flavobacteriales bacterium]|nr:T9SS type A sorting domain-containing protein [Flavobacteriales bacterium]
MTLKTFTLLSTFLFFFQLNGWAENLPLLCSGVLNVTGSQQEENDTVFVCVGQSLDLEDASVLDGVLSGRDWNFGDGNTELNALLSNQTSHAYSEEGVFSLELTVTSTLCGSLTVTKTVVVLGNPQYEVVIDSIGCHGGCDGGLTFQILSDNSSFYSVVWDVVGSPDTMASNLCAGDYNAAVTDGFGCTSLLSGPITIPDPELLTAVITLADTIDLCPDDGITDIGLTLLGGVGGYIADWGTSSDINVVNASMMEFNPTMNSLDRMYNVTVLDAHGCAAEDSIYIRSTPSFLQGNVTVGSNPCMNCEVFQYHHGQSPGVWTVISSTTTDAFGNYDFGLIENLLPFIIMAKPGVNYTGVASGFYPEGHKWSLATVFDNVCGMNLTKDVPLLDPMNFNGTNTLQGTLWHNSTGKTQTEDPIPLIDVVVEKTPPGQASGRQTTANDGTYTFGFVPNSDTTYTLYVNVPGVPVTSTYEILANSGNETFCQLDFCLNEDSTEFVICNGNEDPCLTTVIDNSVSGSFRMYPNPNNGMFTIETGKFAKSDAQVRIVDLSGRVVFQKRYAQTPYTINMVNVAEGYYMVQMMNDRETDASPINVIRY